MQRAWAILSSVDSLALQYLSKLSHKQLNFRKTVRLEFLYNFCSKHSSLQEELREIWSKINISLHVKYLQFLSDFNETWIFWLDFETYSYIKFHKYQSSGNRVVPWGWTDTRVLIAAFRNFANALEVNDSSIIAGDRLICYIIIFQEMGQYIVTAVFKL